MACFVTVEYSNVFLQLTSRAVENVLAKHNRPAADYIVVSSFSKAILIFQHEMDAVQVCFGDAISSLDIWVSTPEDIVEALEYTSTVIFRELIIGKPDATVFQRFLLQLLLVSKEGLDIHGSMPQASAQAIPPRSARIFAPILGSDLENGRTQHLTPSIASPAASVATSYHEGTLQYTLPGVFVCSSSTGRVYGFDGHLHGEVTPSISSKSASVDCVLLASPLAEMNASRSRESQMSPFQIVDAPTPELDRIARTVDIPTKRKRAGKRTSSQKKSSARPSLRLTMKRFAHTGRTNGGLSLRLRKASGMKK